MQKIKYKAVKYIRLSSADDKQGESDSIVNQRKLIDEFLKQHPEIEAVSEKVDDGFSGILFDRPAFKEMMQEIEVGKVNCILTKDLSRFGREYIETGRYLRRILPAYGVRFIAINDNIDTLNDSGDDLSISLKSILNDAYCRDISIKTRSALNSKRASGEFIGACPVYGYRKSENNHNQLVVDSYPASVVRDIFRMKLDGASAKSISETLNSRGILSPIEYKKDRGLPHPKHGFGNTADAKWSATTVIRILKDEIYTGVLIQGKCGTPNYKLKEIVQKPQGEWHRTENAHEAIIRPQDFSLVQKIMRLDTRTSPNNDKVYIFSGILICGSCGNRMTRKTVPYKEARYHYYYCPTGKANCCEFSGMPKESELVGCVLDSIKAHISNVASLEAITQGLDVNRVGHELAASLKTQLGENKARLEKISAFKAGLYENMISGILSKKEFKSLKDKYSEDAAVLMEANLKLQQEMKDVLSCKHERMAWTEHFSNFANLDVLDRKTVIHLVESIKVITKTEIEIIFNYQAEYDKALVLLQKEVA